jgi:hypothetical protein
MTDNKHMTTNKKQEQDGQTKNKPQTTNKGTKNTRTIAKVKNKIKEQDQEQWTPISRHENKEHITSTITKNTK